MSGKRGRKMRVLDVSNYQGDIDWKKVKADGIEGVIIRAGWGKGNVDPKFIQNIAGASAEGLNIGIYWFSYAYTVQMAKHEAIYCHATIGNYRSRINLPVFYDWEYDSMRWAEKNGVKPGKNLITEMNMEFCRAITEIGYKAGYYLNLDYSKNYIDESRLNAYKRWFARYTTTEQKDCYLWQYTSKGRVQGINGNVDMNILHDTTDTVTVIPDPVEEQQKNNGKVEVEYDMPVIKKGSRGKAVKIWQIIVGVEADGVFGAKTLEATKEFQRKKKLVIDGIVGEKSWKAGLDSV